MTQLKGVGRETPAPLSRQWLLGTSAHKNSTKFATFPELDEHVFVDPDCLELKGKALLGIDLFSHIAEAANKEMLEDRLKAKPIRKNVKGKEAQKGQN